MYYTIFDESLAKSIYEVEGNWPFKTAKGRVDEWRDVTVSTKTSVKTSEKNLNRTTCETDSKLELKTIQKTKRTKLENLHDQRVKLSESTTELLSKKLLIEIHTDDSEVQVFHLTCYQKKYN